MGEHAGHEQRDALRERPEAGFELPDSTAVVFSDLDDGMTLADLRRSRAARQAQRISVTDALRRRK